MKIAVLVKQVPDTWADRTLDLTTGRVDRGSTDQVIDEIDERALEVALSHRDAYKDTQVIAVTLGPAEAAGAVRKALAIGADAGVHILDDGLAGADARATSAALAAALRDGAFDLIVAGNVSTDGRSGVVPAMVAEHLGQPLLSSLETMELTETQVRGQRVVESGTQRLHAALPAIVTVTERFPDARFPSFRNIMSAKKKPVSTLSLSDLSVAPAGAASTVLSVQARPQRQAGHVVIDKGQAAGELAEFLAAQRLI